MGIEQYLQDIGKSTILSREIEEKAFLDLNSSRCHINKTIFSSAYGINLCQTLLSQGLSGDRSYRDLKNKFLNITTKAYIQKYFDVLEKNPEFATIDSLFIRLPFTREMASRFTSYDDLWSDETSAILEEELAMSFDEFQKRVGDVKEHSHLLNQSIDIVVESNILYVASIARKYTKDPEEILDYIAEGNKGMIRALDTFDVTKGYKFSTYCTHWVKQHIKRYMDDNSRTIRVPVHQLEKVRLLQKSIAALANSLGKDPSPAEIEKNLGISQRKQCELLLPVQDAVSLDQKVGDGEAVFGDFVPSKYSIESELYKSELKQEMHALLLRLPINEQKVLMYRFGLDGNGERTLEEVGKKFHVTRERIRQIEAKALRKMRNPKVLRKLEAFR